jgi:hypothetical protein
MYTESGNSSPCLSRYDRLTRIRFAIAGPLAIVACIVFATTALSQTADKRETPFLEDWINIRPIEVARLPVEHASVLQLKALSHTLSDAEKLLGPGFIERNAGESGPNRVCYCAANADDNVRLVLYAGSSGGWKSITGFKLLARDSALEQCQKCTQSKLISKTISTASGLRIGMTRGQFDAVIGYPPSRVANGRLFFFFHTVKRVPLPRGDKTKGSTSSSHQASQKVDYCCFLEARFSNGLLVALSVNITETT